MKGFVYYRAWYKPENCMCDIEDIYGSSEILLYKQNGEEFKDPSYGKFNKKVHIEDDSIVLMKSLPYNGRTLIFEGDILCSNSSYGSTKLRYLINLFHNEEDHLYSASSLANTGLRNNKTPINSIHSFKDYVVCGNIFENPEEFL